MNERAVNRKARSFALQLLYQIEIGRAPGLELDRPDVFTDALDNLIADWSFGKRPEGPARDYATHLVRGVMAYRTELDEKITAQAHNWTLERMLVIDRNILRLAAYEMLHTGVPAPVVINEAVELAKAFGDDKSPRFVNGLLDALAPKQTPPAEE